MDVDIPHHALSDEEKRECMEIMKAGNSLMKAWAEEFFGQKNKAAAMRRGLFRWAADPQDPQAINPAVVGLPLSVLDVMLKVRTIEAKLMFGHVRMVCGLARRFGWLLNMTYLDLDDLILEGLIALRDAIYTYDKPNMAGFITYANFAVRRRLRRKINKATDFGGFTKQGFKLLEQYNAARRKLEAQLGNKVQFGTVFMTMQLTQDDERHLRSMLRRCVRASVLSGTEGNLYENMGETPEVRDIDLKLLQQVMDKDGVSALQQDVVVAAATGRIAYDMAADLATRAQGRRNHQEQVDLILEATSRGDRFWQAVEQANLTPMERELVEEAVKGRKNFQSEIAKTYINPSTNAAYSRMSPTNMLRRAYKRIRQHLDVPKLAA